MVGENRVHPRLVVRLLVKYRSTSSKDWHQGTIHDLSASGAALLTPVRLSPETLIAIRFHLPDAVDDPENSIEVESLVLRTDAVSEVGGNKQFRAACHFLDLFGHSYERVRRYVFERTGGAKTGSSASD
jgi:hypothetical protein